MSEMNNSAPALMDHSFEGSDSVWNEEIDLDVWYQAERAEVEDVVRDALDLSVWSLESKKEQTMVYLHCKNNETQSYAVRAVTRITGSVQSVVECLRSPDSATLRTFNKLFHARVFLDSEVLHAHQEHTEESLTLKWLAFSNGKNTLGRGKEFCIREYTTIVRDHDAFGTFGVCKFESYDGLGARYAVRGKADSFSKTLFEPSSFVVYEAAEEGMVVVTLTFAMQKARGTTNCVSSGVKALSMRLAHDLSNLQHAVQHTRFLPTSLADKREWVNDSERSNCSLCVQTFSMLKRRHHCRVCGEVVCSSCTVFKTPTANLEGTNGKIRVCKACLGKGSSESHIQKPPPPVDTIATSPSKSNNQQFKNITLSTFSSSSTSSDESRRSGDDAFSSSLVKGNMNSSSMYMNKHSTSSSSFSECEGGPSPRHHSQPASSFKQPVVLSSSTSNRNKHSENRTQYFNEDFQEICMLAMETLQCAMAGIRTDDFELVTSFDGQSHPELPRSLPTFRRIASRGKPCIVLDVSSDKRISGEKRTSAKLQFFIGIPLILDGEVVGDLCVADRHARDTIDHKAVEVLMVLGKTITQYMTTREYIADLADFKMNQRRKRREHKEAMGLNSSFSSLKEVAF